MAGKASLAEQISAFTATPFEPDPPAVGAFGLPKKLAMRFLERLWASFSFFSFSTFASFLSVRSFSCHVMSITNIDSVSNISSTYLGSLLRVYRFLWPSWAFHGLGGGPTIFRLLLVPALVIRVSRFLLLRAGWGRRQRGRCSLLGLGWWLGQLWHRAGHRRWNSSWHAR